MPGFCPDKWGGNRHAHGSQAVEIAPFGFFAVRQQRESNPVFGSDDGRSLQIIILPAGLYAIDLSADIFLDDTALLSSFKQSPKVEA